MCACVDRNVELVILMSTDSYIINAFCASFIFFDNDLPVKISIYTIYYISFLAREIDHELDDEYHS